MNVLIVLVMTGLVAVGMLALRRARGGSVPPPAERRQWVVDEFSRRKVRQWLLGIPLGAVVVPLLWARHHPLQGFMPLPLPVAILVVVATAVFTYRNWRCPACAKYLGKYAWMQGRCPKCHTALR